MAKSIDKSLYIPSKNLSAEANEKVRKLVEGSDRPRVPGKKRKKPEKKEHILQVKLIHLLIEKGIKDYYAIANGGHRSYTVAKDLKAEGVIKGIPDLCFYIPSKYYHGLYIEVKADNTGYPSADQKDKIKRLNDRGYCARVCKGLENCKGLIMAYLSGNLIEDIVFKVGYKGNFKKVHND